MRVGIHDRLFVKNVCAIGLSAGFIEPLESNGLLSVHEFLINLVKVMKRGNEDTISQWDRDSFNMVCKTFFDSFAEFVAMHYSLSHREDTKYWKDISNKSFLKNTIAKNKDFELNASAKMNDNLIYRNDGGIHCISTGMRYFGVDVLKDNSAKSNILMIGLREKEVNKWNIICKDKPKLLQFLKDNIHND